MALYVTFSGDPSAPGETPDEGRVPIRCDAYFVPEDEDEAIRKKLGSPTRVRVKRLPAGAGAGGALSCFYESVLEKVAALGEGGGQGTSPS